MLTYLALLAAASVVLFRTTAVVTDPERERQSLRAFLDALAEARIHHKEAYTRMGISKGQWSEICSGQRHTPSHSRMLNLGTKFWMAYLPLLAAVVIKHEVEAIAEDFEIRRAS